MRFSARRSTSSFGNPVARAAMVSTLMACGARTEFDDFVLGDSETSTSDASATDSAVDEVDAYKHPIDASLTDVFDASVFDVAPDVVPVITCSANTTTALVATPYGGPEILIDDDYVYFHTKDGIARVPKGGGSVEPLASAQPTSAVVLRASTLVWARAGATSSTVFTVPKTGGTPTTLLAESTQGFAGLTPGFGDDVFYWGATIENNTLLEVTDTGAIASSMLIPPNAIDVQESDGSIYFAVEYGGITARDPEGTYHYLGKGPGTLTVPSTIRFDADTVYFMNYDYYTSGRWIMSAPKDSDGGVVSILAAHPDGSDGFADMRIDGSVYYTEDYSGLVWRMDPDGSNKTVVGSSDAKEGAFGLAVDDRCVYWRSGSHVYAAPR